MMDQRTNIASEKQVAATPAEATGVAARIAGIAALIAAGIGLYLAPSILNNYGLYLLSYWAITAIAVQGLNLTMGYAGKVSLAQASFMGIGAYTSTLLIQKLGFNFWLAGAIAVIACIAIGALVGFPALRVKGHYLAFVTLGFNELVILVLRNEDWLTYGSLGILNIKRPDILGVSLFSHTNFYYFCMVTLLLVSSAVWFVVRSPWGQAFRAIRDNTYRAESLGLSTTTYTLLAFAIGAALAGIAGVMVAPLVEFTEPGFFALERSLIFILMLMVGGRGTLSGPFIGAFIVIVLPEWLRFTEDLYLILFSIFVMVLIIFFPQGVAGLVPYLQRLIRSKTQKEG